MFFNRRFCNFLASIVMQLMLFLSFGAEDINEVDKYQNSSPLLRNVSKFCDVEFGKGVTECRLYFTND